MNKPYNKYFKTELKEGFFSDLKDFFKGAVEDIKNAGKKVDDEKKQKIKDKIEAAKDQLSTVNDQIKDFQDNIKELHKKKKDLPTLKSVDELDISGKDKDKKKDGIRKQDQILSDKIERLESMIEKLEDAKLQLRQIITKMQSILVNQKV